MMALIENSWPVLILAFYTDLALVSSFDFLHVLDKKMNNSLKLKIYSS